MTVPALARRIEEHLGIPVMDATGLTGKYDMDWPQMSDTDASERLDEVTEAPKQFGAQALIQSPTARTLYRGKLGNSGVSDAFALFSAAPVLDKNGRL